MLNLVIVGKLIDCEPSRFLEEIDEQYLEYLRRKPEAQQNRFIPEDIFSDVPPSTIRFKKPISRSKIPKPKQSPKMIQPKFMTPKNLKPVSKAKTPTTTNLFDSAIIVGNIVQHQRFGKGEVKALEGIAANKKATILFLEHGTKKLMLQFAKLKIIG